MYNSRVYIEIHNINTDIIKYNINELGMTPTNNVKLSTIFPIEIKVYKNRKF